MKVLQDQPMKLFKAVFQVYLIFTLLAVVIENAAASRLPEEPDQTIKIGLLIPDNKSIAARQGAELAIRKANEKGGLNGCPFQIVVRSMEGPWGTGSKEAVSMIFEEKVWAILGSHDGRNAHLVEQACTKAGVVFVSAWASDPTLSQAFVPWFFNCVPTDLQQAAALIEEIYNKRKFNKVATVSDNDYDSKQALDNFLKRTRLTEKTEPVQFFFENYSNNFNALPDQINKADINCIVLFCRPVVSLKIIQALQQRKMNQPVFGPLYLLNENELSGRELQNYDYALLIPTGNWSETKSTAFRQEFMDTYGKSPGMVAAYAFDGMSLLIEALRKAGSPDREKIQEALSEIYYEGVTGLIRFDDKGNRSGIYDLNYIKNGVPVTIDRD